MTYFLVLNLFYFVFVLLTIENRDKFWICGYSKAHLYINTYIYLKGFQYLSVGISVKFDKSFRRLLLKFVNIAWFLTKSRNADKFLKLLQGRTTIQKQIIMWVKSLIFWHMTTSTFNKNALLTIYLRFCNQWHPLLHQYFQKFEYNS